MALPVSLNSRIWSAKGVAPGVGDETYQAGEQPIAPYDNWAMWSVTRDLYNVTDELGDHNDHHEVGGRDEIDLQNLQVNGVAALNGDPNANEFRLVDPASSTSVTRIDVDNNLVKQWPAFDVRAQLRKGARTSNDIVRANAAETKLYDYAAGSTGKFHHAKYADNAGHADYADVAGELEGADAGDFLTADMDVTITGNWTHQNLLDADISGNAATADHADTADHATSADTAGYADDSDMVDGYHAQELIDTAQQAGEWSAIDSYEHSTTGSKIDWTITSPTVYDAYRVELYHENHQANSRAGLGFQIGKDSVDQRHRYIKYFRYLGGNQDSGGWYITHHNYFNTGGASAQERSYSVHYIFAPPAVNAVEKMWPLFGSGEEGTTTSVDEMISHGQLETNYPNGVDTFRFFSSGNQSTGRVTLSGRNMG